MDSSSPTVVRIGDDRSFGGQSFTFARTRTWTKPVTGGGFRFAGREAASAAANAAGAGHARLRPRYRDERCRYADGYGVAG
jgi:hypothetical protein